MARAAVGAAAILIATLACAACSACGKKAGGEPTVAPGTASVVANRTSPPLPEAGSVAFRDVAMWTSARTAGEGQGTTEDLASLANHEGAAGLVEAAADDVLRPTALRAMGYARGWAQVPYLAKTAAGTKDDDAHLALDSLSELAARPRRSEDVEDAEELREGCETLGALARDAARARDRRIGAIRALRMMPCPKQEIPGDLDAR